MTLTELIYKLEMFEQNVLNSLNKVDVQKLTDGKLYKKVISSYYKEVRGNLTSWVNKYLDPNPIILSDTNDVFNLQLSFFSSGRRICNKRKNNFNQL